jgi:hypothetical protein
MCHNGSNKYQILGLATIKLDRYHCSKCGLNLQEENIFLDNMKFEIGSIFAGLYQVLRNLDVSYEGISDVMDYLIPQSSDTICRRFSDSVASVQLPETSPIQVIHYDEQHPKAGRCQKYRLTLLNGMTHEVIAEEVSDNKSQKTIKIKRTKSYLIRNNRITTRVTISYFF